MGVRDFLDAFKPKNLKRFRLSLRALWAEWKGEFQATLYSRYQAKKKGGKLQISVVIKGDAPGSLRAEAAEKEGFTWKAAVVKDGKAEVSAEVAEDVDRGNHVATVTFTDGAKEVAVIRVPVFIPE